MNIFLLSLMIGQTIQKAPDIEPEGEFTTLLGEPFYKIRHYDALEPFFITLVSSSDQWLFISTTGGLTAGRVSAENALLPYYTADKIAENNEQTGHKAIFLITRTGAPSLWEPFSIRHAGCYQIERNLYKNEAGSALVFEEINFELGVTYRYAWRTSEIFGFVKTSWLINHGEGNCQIELVDGLQNILPANITSQTQNIFSNLLDAYKRNELDPETGLGIFSLSSTLTDLAEPSESLRATTVAQVGLDSATYLLSSTQLDNFRKGKSLSPETDVRGERGAYFVHSHLTLPPGETHSWHVIAEVMQTNATVVSLLHKLKGSRDALAQAIEADIAQNQLNLHQRIASADGVQSSSDPLSTGHHYANVMFNIMRGGIFADQYNVDATDFLAFIYLHNKSLHTTLAETSATLPIKIPLADLLAHAQASTQANLLRLSYAYLPLTFSRRHGDPSRPWNRFAIQIKNPDGSQRLDYEGNWRDIFQNWEALACSYPEYVEHMLSVFLNATTVDGYNPYRVTRTGIDWEKPEPGNPWANIGYWSDHQIIYLQKLLELSQKFHPGKLQEFLNTPLFSYAHVPYRLKSYETLVQDSYNTIEFDWELQEKIAQRVLTTGADGRLFTLANGQVYHVTLTEKMLTLLLAKLANFVPEGGIWMNTQRPEWNDANNALVGKGLSVVTLGYLRRFVDFFSGLMAGRESAALLISKEVAAFFGQMNAILDRFQPQLSGPIRDDQRRQMMDALGTAGSEYRWCFYQTGLSGDTLPVQGQEIKKFLHTVQQYIEHSLRANQRPDHLYHAYNILHLKESTAQISYLDEMLEGQVAILSSGLLSGEEALTLLQSLRNSALYRADQHSYILYPNRELPGFLQKNRLLQEQVDDLPLVKALQAGNDTSLLERDMNGVYHFNAQFQNIKDVNKALTALWANPRYAAYIETDAEKIRVLFEQTFHHDQFTGRSGTFFAYEGLGSIYWHMVSKLLLAVQENALRFREGATGCALREIYGDVRKGLGFNKSPSVYGAFPMDPYSHTPWGRGAKQPGMTGMVKEEILTRLAEMGVMIQNGQLGFDFQLFDVLELRPTPSTFRYLDVSGTTKDIPLPADSLAFTFCQVPIVVCAGSEKCLTLYFSENAPQVIEEHVLDEETSQHIFRRDGTVEQLVVQIVKEN